MPIAPKLLKKVGSGVVYITAKNVPPTTISTDGTSTNGPRPPPLIMAPAIMPHAPIKPMIDARSMVKPYPDAACVRCCHANRVPKGAAWLLLRVLVAVCARLQRFASFEILMCQFADVMWRL